MVFWQLSTLGLLTLPEAVRSKKRNQTTDRKNITFYLHILLLFRLNFKNRICDIFRKLQIRSLQFASFPSHDSEESTFQLRDAIRIQCWSWLILTDNFWSIIIARANATRCFFDHLIKNKDKHLHGLLTPIRVNKLTCFFLHPLCVFFCFNGW